MDEPFVIVIKTSHRMMRNYNYLVVDLKTREAVIVDPAWEIEKIKHVLEEVDAKLRGVLITHSHMDHINLAKSFSENYKCPIWMSRAEVQASGYRAENLRAIGEQPWQVGRMLIQPILTPGHTAGCVCYLIGDNLFTGDVLFAEGCGICPDIESARIMYDSLAKLKRKLLPCTRVFPGHSYGKPPGQTFSSLLKDNIYLQFDDREVFANFRMRFQKDSKKLFNFS